MNRAERERQNRRQRMLAREQGRDWAPGDTLPGTDTGQGVRVPKKVRRAPPAAAKPSASVSAPVGNLKPLSPILRRRKRRRRLAMAGLALVVLLVLAAATGAITSVADLAAEALDSAVLYLNRSGAGWPADTGVATPDRAEVFGGGFVVMDREDVAIYSAYGGRIRTIQPGYNRPALAMGRSRFVLYNRAGTEFRVENRTKTLYTQTRDAGILLCAVANNGSLAVLTQSDRYAAVLEVLDAHMRGIITYSLAQNDGVPVTLAFASDNRRLASGAIVARNGQMQSLVYCMNTREESLGPCYMADPGSLVLRVEWLSGQRILAVFDTYIALIDASNGSEVGRYDYGGAVLQSVDSAGGQTALLLSIRGGNNLVLLGERMTTLAIVPAAQASSVVAALDCVYLLDSGSVSCYSYAGVQRWQQKLDARPQAVLDAAQTLVLTGGVARPLTGSAG